jgi:Rps23 Pro-64 3,4-dihydroxylase Tpa1-like proline 4-hydroxylase
MSRGGLACETAGASSAIIVTDDFLTLELAQAMRQDIDAHFSNPNAHRADTHQIWNYWFVPQQYTYLRTSPEKIIARTRIDAFMSILGRWSLTNLGMGAVTWPYLSLYVGGCRQGWHNDSTNGRFGFVYSLTKNERRTSGGETLILREGDPFRANLATPAAGSRLHQLVEPRFNRLIVFDDRLAHAVERVDGEMDPVEGRFVLHGHLSEANATVIGALPLESVVEPLAAVLRSFQDEASAQVALYHGPLAVRVRIAATGTVENCAVLLDRVIHRDAGHIEWEPLLARLIDCISGAKFPSAGGETTVIQPIVFGGPLRRGR